MDFVSAGGECRDLKIYVVWESFGGVDGLGLGGRGGSVCSVGDGEGWMRKRKARNGVQMTVERRSLECKMLDEMAEDCKQAG